jgi:hypothetical protein
MKDEKLNEYVEKINICIESDDLVNLFRVILNKNIDHTLKTEQGKKFYIVSLITKLRDPDSIKLVMNDKRIGWDVFLKTLGLEETA